MTGYSEGKHDDPADTQDRLVKIGSKYQATAPSVADGDNVYLLVDAAGRVLITGSVAHDAVDAGNPVKIGGHALSAGPTQVAAGDRVNAFFDRSGRQVVVIGGFDSSGSLAADVDGDWADGDATTLDRLRTDAAIRALAPDGATDVLRTLGNTGGAGLGVLAAAPWIPGASIVKSVRGTIGSTTRATLLTPSSGKKVRIISVEVTGQDTAAHNVEVYFSTGANITTTAGKEIAEPLVDITDAPNYHEPSPDGGGSIGAIDDVVSMRCSTAPTTASIVHVKYREE